MTQDPVGVKRNPLQVAFRVRPIEPLILGSLALLLLFVALLACYMPARRATRVDPAAALRCQ